MEITVANVDTRTNEWKSDDEKVNKRDTYGYNSADDASGLIILQAGTIEHSFSSYSSCQHPIISPSSSVYKSYVSLCLAAHSFLKHGLASLWLSRTVGLSSPNVWQIWCVDVWKRITKDKMKGFPCLRLLFPFTLQRSCMHNYSFFDLEAMLLMEIEELICGTGFRTISEIVW